MTKLGICKDFAACTKPARANLRQRFMKSENMESHSGGERRVTGSGGFSEHHKRLRERSSFNHVFQMT